MKLQKALKYKKKLAGEIAQLKSKIQSKNSIIEGTTVSYDVQELHDQLIGKVKELITLKISINKANVKIQELIYKLSEYKGLINFWSSMSTTEGSVNRGYEAVAIKYVVTYNELTKDKWIQFYQTEVDLIQEEIDTFNYTTEIENF